ncbi:MAG: cupredoxin domain-containing protein [Actinomycetota bacterium]
MGFRRTRRAVTACACACALAACGGGGGGGRTVAVTNGSVVVEAKDIAFDPTTIETPAGPLEVTLVEKGQQNHTFLIRGIDGFKLSVSVSESRDSGTVELEPGEYTYYCDVANHEAAGMKGTLLVE